MFILLYFSAKYFISKELILIKNSNILLKPKYDVVFQSLFSDKNKKETGYLISAILDKNVEVIKVNTEFSNIREFPEEKIGRLDLLAETSENELVHIELQLVDKKNTIDRLLYSMCENLSKQLNRGDDYKKIRKTITIALLDFELDELKDIDEMHSAWKWMCDEKVLTNIQELHIIQMTKAKYEYEKNKNNILAQWILFILDPNNKEVKSIMSDNNEIKETTKKLENISEDEDVRKRAEILERWELEEQWGKASLIEYGEKQGIKKGIEKGELQGRQDEKIKIAKNLISLGMKPTDISKATNLTLKEIESLVNNSQ